MVEVGRPLAEVLRRFMRSITRGLSLSSVVAMLACSRVPEASSMKAATSEVSQAPPSPDDGIATSVSLSVVKPSAPSLVGPFRLATPTEADAELSRVHVDGQSFSEADQLATKSHPPNTWDIQIIATTIGNVEKGDAIV